MWCKCAETLVLYVFDLTQKVAKLQKVSAFFVSAHKQKRCNIQLTFYSTWTNFAEYPKLQITMNGVFNRVTKLCSFQKFQNNKHQDEKWTRENGETRLEWGKLVTKYL